MKKLNTRGSSAKSSSYLIHAKLYNKATHIDDNMSVDANPEVRKRFADEYGYFFEICTTV